MYRIMIGVREWHVVQTVSIYDHAPIPLFVEHKGCDHADCIVLKIVKENCIHIT